MRNILSNLLIGILLLQMLSGYTFAQKNKKTLNINEVETYDQEDFIKVTTGGATVIDHYINNELIKGVEIGEIDVITPELEVEEVMSEIKEGEVVEPQVESNLIKPSSDGYVLTSSDVTQGTSDGDTITAFIGDTSVIGTDIIIPSSINGKEIHRIADDVFKDKGLTSVILPATLRDIGKSAFANNALTGAIISETLSSIDNEAFLNNDLTHLMIPNISLIGNRTFKDNRLESVVLGDNLGGIGEEAFMNNLLTRIVVPAVMGIEKRAFKNNNLTELVLNDGMGSIGEEAFMNNSLMNIKLPNMHRIYNNAFVNNNLNSVSIDLNNLRYIGSGIFKGNSNIHEINVHGSPRTGTTTTSILKKIFDQQSEIYYEDMSSISESDNIADGTKLYTQKWKVDFIIGLIGDGRVTQYALCKLDSSMPNGHGGIIQPPAVPEVSNHVFVGWDTLEYTKLTSDLTVTAQYAPDSDNDGVADVNYVVNFEDYDASILKTETVLENNDATPPSNPTRLDYVFTGWDVDFTNVQSNLTVTAQYAPDSNNNGVADVDYTVNFIDYDGSILKTEMVLENNDATPPSDPTRLDYVFTGWDVEFTNIQSNLTVTAQYGSDSNNNGVEDVDYIVVFNDYDGSTIKKETVTESNSATAPINPSRGGYNFIGWDKVFTNVQSDLVITAEYKKKSTGGGGGSGGSGGNGSSDKDDNSDDTNEASINTNNSRKYMVGMPDGTFMPDKELTRAELVVLLDRFYELDQKYEVMNEFNKFPDVNPSEWYGDAVNRMVQEGIIKGYEDGSFRPERFISREELAQVIYNQFAVGCCFTREIKTDFLGNKYTDIYNIWSTDALVGLQTRGLLEDFEGSEFKPTSAITRGETVLMLNRYFGYDAGYGKHLNVSFTDIEKNSELATIIALASTDKMIESRFISDLERELHVNNEVSEEAFNR